MNNIEYKQLDFKVDEKSVTDTGSFEGYASVFGVIDLGDDSVMHGAFTKSLGERRAKLLWQHNTGDPIGVWTDMKEDEHGLFVKGQLISEVQKGREAIALLKAGAIDSMSIGFRTINSEFTDDGIRKLTEVELHEVSLVTFPMLPDAKVTDVKSIETERDFEKFLRDAGYSKSQAVAIASHGYKAVGVRRDANEDDQRDAEATKKDESQAMQDFMASLKQLKGNFNV